MYKRTKPIFLKSCYIKPLAVLYDKEVILGKGALLIMNDRKIKKKTRFTRFTRLENIFELYMYNYKIANQLIKSPSPCHRKNF